MPAQTQKVSLFADLGDRMVKVYAENKDKAPTAQVSLPEGIDNGIARLTSIKIGKFDNGDNKGKHFFMAMGTIVHPIVHGNIKIQGKTTKIGPHAICDTPKNTGQNALKTMGEHWAWVQNHIKLLLVGTNGNVVLPNSDAGLEALFAKLMKEKPHFGFKTFKGKEQAIEQRNGKWYVGDSNMGFASEAQAKAAFPFAGRPAKVIEQWLGKCDAPVVEHAEPGAGINDKTGMPSTNGDTTPPAEPFNELDNGQGDTSADQGDSSGDAGSGDANDPLEGIDLDDLVTRAQDDDADVSQEAKDTFARLCEAVGISDDEANAINTFEELAEAIKVKAEGGDSADDQTETWQPKEEQIYQYFPLDRNKKPAKKAVKCEVLDVDTEAQTVNLKNKENTKLTYKKVPWASLIHEKS